jgi:hypothetical protein
LYHFDHIATDETVADIRKRSVVSANPKTEG